MDIRGSSIWDKELRHALQQINVIKHGSCITTVENQEAGHPE